MIPPGAPAPGLCGACRRRRWVTNRRGSSFLLCARSATDRRFPKYPQLPVLECAGFDPGAPPEASDPGLPDRGLPDPGLPDGESPDEESPDEESPDGESTDGETLDAGAAGPE